MGLCKQVSDKDARRPQTSQFVRRQGTTIVGHQGQHEKGYMMDGHQGIVTVSILRKARPGHMEALEEKVAQILELAARAHGYVGSGVVRGEMLGTPFLNVLLHFASRAELDQWRQSSASRRLIEGALEHVSESPQVTFAEGETGWFDLPATPMAIAPPKWKMCIVTWLAIFPLLTLVLAATAPIISGQHFVLRLFLNTLIIAPLMTWIVMPNMTRLFRKWLFRPSSN